jgi:multiple sugar transport system ATP-binding protein
MKGVKLENIYKSYGDNEILHDINIDVTEGEFLVLVGPSGCGKSTTLRLIAGLETSSKGNIYIGDKLVNDIDPSKRDIAMVFQNYALYPHMTVFENMAFGLKIRKLSEDEINLRVNEAAEILQITDLLQRRPKELSGGQRQRVALGRAIVRKPKVFLFDEPLSNLDAKLRHEMRVEIKKLHQILNTTMIYVTHDQTEAMTMGDRIVVMNDGIIEQMDSPKKMYLFPENKFTASFIGSPQINLIEGEIKKSNDGWTFSNEDIALQIRDSHYQYQKLQTGKIIFGIRSEDINDHYFAEVKDDANTLQSTIEFIEYLGAEMNIHFKQQNTQFIAQFTRTIDARVNNKMSVIFDVNKGHFFKLNGSII